ncbi:long-chain-fatty-acid--CoA ligase [Pseudomonas citronellolis]|uniref:long-chain-fatty-acid--CoA ligase n=1 Tax=Pseudomonas citronellolis TaxID=53408 RepID=UPI0023E41E03|nr:long-chain fatty acid--CoA ligase [Pseudomonas citronellolis]MDF3933901.1 long-chain fatty acid--CoA ligase [Pseudomonas citronellolis]
MHTPWTRSYPAGVSWDNDLSGLSVLDMLDESVRRWPQRPAIDFMGRKIDYRELSSLIDHAARGLQDLGVGPGVHVGLYLPNVPQYVIGFFAVLRAGGTVVNYSPLDAGEVLAHKIEDSRTDILITLDLSSLYPLMERLLHSTRLRTLVVGTLGEFGGQPGATHARLQQEGQLAEVRYGEHCLPFKSLFNNAGDWQAHPLPALEQALAVLQYTGGTTGLPKGAMLTHANLGAAASQVVMINIDNDRLMHRGQDSVLVVLPLFHVYAMVGCLLFPIAAGLEMRLHVRFDAGTVLREIHEHRIGAFPGVPTMFTALLSHPQVGEFDLSCLKVCASGGAPMPVELMQQFKAITGCQITEGWGMTETCTGGTFTPPERPKAGSCGVPHIGVEVCFLDTEDPERKVAPGQNGEIAVRGPNIMRGYWNNPSASAESFTTDGYFRTGDVGYMDEDGYVYIVDRTKDMLLCGGFNVYPRVIEEAIYAHPAVEEVMVLGIPDAYRGQSPKAYVKLRPGHTPFSLDELKAFLKDSLGKHEMVQALEIRADLPKTAVGKLSKKLLKDEIAAAQAGDRV